MSLTIGDAPFGTRPGTFNFEKTGPDRVLYLDDSPRWIRAELGGEAILSSKRAELLHETGHLPVYYFPREDVRMNLLTETETLTECPYKGTASYWSVEGADDLVWCYEDPIPAARDTEGLLAFFNERVDLEVDGDLQQRPKTRWS